MKLRPIEASSRVTMKSQPAEQPNVLVEVEGQGDPAFRKEVWVRISEQEPKHEPRFLGRKVWRSILLSPGP
jgi:hypothetical protein